MGQLERLRDRYVMGDLSKSEYVLRRQALEEELSQTRPPVDPRLDEAEEMLGDLSRIWTLEEDPAKRRRLLAMLGLLFPSPGGAVWRKDNFMARIFRPAGRRAGLAPLRFHDLRHTYAALTVAAGAHPKLLQAQLGHTSINVTLNTYGHLFPDAFVDIGDALDAIVRVQQAREVEQRG